MWSTAPTKTRPQMSMKLLIDNKARRVLFAEADKDVVDFLFSLLALPVATAVSLLGMDSMVGSIGHLYASAVKLDDAYVLSEDELGALLHPTVCSQAAASDISLLRLPEPDTPSAAPSKQFFWCGQNHSCSFEGGAGNNYVTDASGTKCPGCGKPMTDAIHWADPDSGGSGQAATGGGAKGFVQDIVTYTVLDNLTITPTSAISSITQLNTFAVTDIGALQEKTVLFGYKEGLAILKASLKSKTVLTDVFLAA